MGKKNQVNIVLINVPPALKKRLKVEALKQGRSTSEVALEILDRSLPRYEEFTAEDNEKNGRTQTLREQFERATN